MNTDIHIIDDASETPSTIESYIHRLFQGIDQWFDQGTYEIVRSSSELKLTFQYMEPLIRYLDIPHKDVSSNPGAVRFSLLPDGRDINLIYTQEALYMYLDPQDEKLLIFYFTPLIHYLGTLYQFPDEINQIYYIPLPDGVQRLYFFQLPRDHMSVMRAKSLETHESLRQELIRFNTEDLWRDNRAIFDLLRQFHESFMDINNTNLVFSSLYPGHEQFTFKWLVLDPKLSIYSRYMPSRLYSRDPVQDAMPDPSRFKMDDIITFGWSFQVALKY